MALGTILGVAAGIGGLIKLGKKAWGAIKQPKPKIQVSSATGQIVSSQPVYPMGGAGIQQVAGLPVPYTGGGLPALAGGTSMLAPAIAAGTAAATGTLLQNIPWWKGPGGKLQLPWNDPRVPDFLKSVSLDDAYLRIYYRAPKGYVVVRDPNGKPYAMLKSAARSLGLWKPAARPPISATDWKHFKRNKAIEKKLRKIVPARLRTKKVVEKRKGK